jgi:hypothetical protein
MRGEFEVHDVDELPAGHAQHTALQHRVICGERLPGRYRARA